MATVPAGTRSTATNALLLEVLAGRGEVWARAASASMHPLIQPGDLLLLRALPPGATLGTGALLGYRRGHQIVVHRLVGRAGASLLVKGDAIEPMERIRADHVVGRVVAVRRPAGRLADLERFPWPVLDRLLGVIARLAGCCAPISPAMVRRILRVPFHAAAVLLR